jgi:branched-chain amino acid transport system ATP-binding protein
VATEPILATRDLRLDIGGASIVADVSLEVPEGEFLGIIGPNGAGKTSLFNLLSGLMRPTGGRIELRGNDVTYATPSARARAGLGRTFQLSSVFGRLSAFENVRLAADAALGGTMRIWRRAARPGEAVKRAHRALGAVGLEDREGVPAALLAGGEKRKLEVAMLLAADPAVILLDEPMAGVSAEDVPGLVEVIRSLTSDGKKTVLMVEHHLEVVIGLADRVAVMHHGRLLACDTPESVMRNATVQEAYVGEPL